LQSWYALHVASCTEALVRTALADVDIEGYYPAASVKSARLYRPDIERPFFPGYVFGRFNIEERTPVIRIPQVIRILGSGIVPEVIPDSEIDAVRIMTTAAIACPCPFLASGVRVRVRYGSLAGCEGVVVRRRGKTRVVVSIKMLERSISAEVDADGLEPAKAIKEP